VATITPATYSATGTVSAAQQYRLTNAPTAATLTLEGGPAPFQLKDLKALDGAVSDPKSEVEQQPENCKNETRSIKPNIFVAIGICTHLGCSPTYRPDVAPADLGADWKGGFFCPCHGSKFDIAGRVYKGVPAPTNLVVPPYKYLSDTTVLVGED